MNKVRLNVNDGLVSLSKSKGKKKQGRSGMLSVLMKVMSGDNGDSLVSSFNKGNYEEWGNKLKSLIDSAVSKLQGSTKSEASEISESRIINFDGIYAVRIVIGKAAYFLGSDYELYEADMLDMSKYAPNIFLKEAVAKKLASQVTVKKVKVVGQDGHGRLEVE